MKNIAAYDAAADLLAALSTSPPDPETIARHMERARAHKTPLEYVATLHRYDLPPASTAFTAPTTADPLHLLRAAAKASGSRIVRRIPTDYLAAAVTPSGRVTITHPWSPAPPDPLAIDDRTAHRLARDYRQALQETKETGIPDPDTPRLREDLRALARPLLYSVRWQPRRGQAHAYTFPAPADATLSQVIQRAKTETGLTGKPFRSPYESTVSITTESSAGTLTIAPHYRPKPAPRPLRPEDIDDSEV